MDYHYFQNHRWHLVVGVAAADLDGGLQHFRFRYRKWVGIQIATQKALIFR
jgi:hypothetical protein